MKIHTSKGDFGVGIFNETQDRECDFCGKKEVDVRILDKGKEFFVCARCYLPLTQPRMSSMVEVAMHAAKDIMEKCKDSIGTLFSCNDGDDLTEIRRERLERK